jgi:surface protein
MGYMFENCTSLISLNLSNWDTSSAMMRSSMFSNCKSLRSINVSNCDESTKQFIRDRLADVGLDTTIVQEWYSLPDVFGTDMRVRYMSFNTPEPKLTDYTMYIRVNVGFTEVYATLAPNPDKPTELICNVGDFGIETTFDITQNISFTGFNVSDYTVDYITISSIGGADAEEAMTMIQVATE